MSAHTPGPWIVTEDCETRVIRGADVEQTEGGVTYSFRDYVASTWGGPHEANARLIAAAPELLVALQEIMADMESDFGTGYDYKKARAAIAKATGAQS